MDESTEPGDVPGLSKSESKNNRFDKDEMNAKQIARQARKELKGGGFMPKTEATWHPYYWLGRLRAAEAVMKDDRVRRRNGKPKADRPTR